MVGFGDQHGGTWNQETNVVSPRLGRDAIASGTMTGTLANVRPAQRGTWPISPSYRNHLLLPPLLP